MTHREGKRPDDFHGIDALFDDVLADFDDLKYALRQAEFRGDDILDKVDFIEVSVKKLRLLSKDRYET